ncbi:MAG: hypothetical protein IJ975_03360 [Clostridia bacterium]|nr:hypothetical protein [Clostridia bacterium]
MLKYLYTGDMMQLNAYLQKHFTPFDYATTQKILAEKFNLKNLSNGKKIFLCVGAIGSGKSTVIANLYAQNLLHYPYLSDKIVAEKLSSTGAPKSTCEQVAAATHKIAKNLVKSGHSFCWEPEDTNGKYLEIVDFAKKQGFKIEVFYVMTDAVNINLGRTMQRFGQSTTAQQVLDSFYGIEKQVIKLIEHCDTLDMFDNTSQFGQTKPRANAQKETGETFCL